MWQKKISQDIEDVTKDDAKMSLIAFGWDNFLEIKDDFENDYINLINSIRIISRLFNNSLKWHQFFYIIQFSLKS